MSGSDRPTASGLRSLAVCVATFRRPEGLRRLLASLARQRLPASLRVEVRVVDNDPEASAKAVVDEEALGFPLGLSYVHEPIPNVAQARNAAIDVAPADLLAFVDDDEVAAADWLERLVHALDENHADAVFGTVERAVIDGPRWIRRGDFFASARPEGPLNWLGARTGNALVRGSWFYARDLRFDVGFGLTGGEDADLFARLERAGAVLYGEPAAQVTEIVEAKRLGLNYLTRRAWRQGLTIERVRQRQGLGHHPLTSLAYRVLGGSANLVRGLPAALRGRPERSARGVVRLALAGGGVAGWLAREAAVNSVGSYA